MRGCVSEHRSWGGFGIKASRMLRGLEDPQGEMVSVNLPCGRSSL